MAFTRNLRLRLSPDLTADARFNLERIDQLGSVFPIGSSSTQTINSSADIRLNANATTLGGDGNGLVFAPNLRLSNTLQLESGAFTLSLRAGSLSSNLTLSLPDDVGTNGQFLQTNGVGTLTWNDPPTSNFSTLNDTTFTNLAAGELAQYDGTTWRNISLPNTRQASVFSWLPADGNTKTIAHNFSSDKIQVWIYEPASSSQVFVERVDYPDTDTILLTAHTSPDSEYEVHLVQTA